MASPYLNVATDGTDLGANMALVTALTAVAASGDRRSVTETRYSGGWLTYNAINRAQYPSTLLDTDTLPDRSTLTVHTVNSDSALSTLLTNGSLVTGGHVVVLDHTVTYTGNYYGAFPVRLGDALPGGNNVVVFISKAIYDSMPAGSWTSTVCPPKKQIGPADKANLAFFKTMNTLSAFMVSGATRGWRFIGLRFEPDTSVAVVSHLATAGNPDGAIQTDVSKCPSNIGWDRCWFDGHPSGEIRHACELHCKAGYVIDSYFGNNLHAVNYTDSQCLTLYNGPGPFRIVNNRVCGQIENVIFGGAGSNCGIIADVEVRFNTFTRQVTDKGVWGTKCAFEVKKVIRLLVEGNIIENTWPDRQIGAALLLKSESYGDGARIGYTSDVICRWNLLRNVSAACTFAAQANAQTDPAFPINRAFVYGNLFRVGASGFDASQNPMIGMYLSTNCGFVHNTIVSEGSVLSVAAPDGQANTFDLSDNIFGATSYGLKGGGVAEGSATVAADMPNGTCTKNAFTGRTNGGSTPYPAGNYFPANEAAIQYTNATAKDYSLLGTSQTGGGAVTPVATSLRIRTQPADATSGSPLPVQPVVEILDQFGNIFSSTATITATSDSGSVSETGGSVAAVAGVATFTALTPTAGATTATAFTFSASGLPSVTSNSVNVVVPVASPAATALQVVQQPSGAVSSVPLTTQPIVRVIDQYGNPITSTATITAAVVTTGPVTFTAGTTKAAVAGVATFTTLTANTTEEYHAAVLFTSPGLTSVTSGYFVVAVFAQPVPTPTPDPPPEPPITPTTDPVPSSLVVTRQPGPVSRLYSGKKWPQQPVVEARDTSGNLMTSFSGPITAYLGEGSAGVLHGTATVTAVAGVARWTNLYITGTGTSTLAFTDGPYDGSA